MATLLADTLRLAVPLWADRMRDYPKSSLQRLASANAQTMAEKGDCLMFASNGTPMAFNAMAQGLACMCLLMPDFNLEALLQRLAKSEAEFHGDVPPRHDRPR